MATVKKVWTLCVMCIVALVALAVLNAASVHWQQQQPLRQKSSSSSKLWLGSNSRHVPSSTSDLPSAIEITIGAKLGRVSPARNVAESANVHQQGVNMPMEVQLSSDVQDLVDTCMREAHLHSNSTLMELAKKNAKFLLQEYRKVVPVKSLGKFGNHCWKNSFYVQWDTVKYSGYIGNISFNGLVKNVSFSGHLFYYLNRQFPRRRFKTDVLCLPNVYMVGFPKCGSSFAYCLINNLILGGDDALSIVKEPHFWVVETVTMPTANDIGSYYLNFIPRLQHFAQLVKRNPSELLLVDGAVNKMIKWPRFTPAEDDVANYCLLPAVIPRLLPNSKFITVMREPVSMLYSTFWYSCSRLKGTVPKVVQSKGPDIFHEQVVRKLHLFNDCMKDDTAPSLSQPCELGSGHNYSSCILHRLPLLDKCSQKISRPMYSPSMPNCGRVRLTMGLYFIHIRKWMVIVPREKFLFLTLDDLVHSLSNSAHNILQFMGVKKKIDLGHLRRMAGSCDKNSQQTVNYKADPTLHMRNDTRVLLEAFYKPFNTLLAQLIGRKLPWHY